MILCLVIFLVTLPGESKHQRVATGYLEEAGEYLARQLNPILGRW